MMNLTPQIDHSLDDSIDTPIVSMLMPCYNVGETIDEVVGSLLAQTLQDHEIMAVDEGSSISTAERLVEWMERDSRVRVLSLSHGGIIPTLNACLTACRASLIVCMDADDRAHLERLARQVAYLEAHPDLTLVSCLVEGFSGDQVQ